MEPKQVYVSLTNNVLQRYTDRKTVKKKKDQIHVAKDCDVDLKYVQQFAEKLENNPDKYFSGKYNWYFTGSNMIVMNMPTEDVLFHVTGEHLNKLGELTFIWFSY